MTDRADELERAAAEGGDRAGAPGPPPGLAPPGGDGARSRPRLALRLLSGSIVRRYSLLLLASALLPMVVVGVLYDRYTRSLLDQFTGEQLDAQLAAMASRLGAFLDARAYQRAPAAEGRSIGSELAEAERRLLENALRGAGGHRGRAASMLGISRHALKRRMQRLGIR